MTGHSMNQIKAYSPDELKTLCRAWERGIDPTLAKPFVRAGLLIAQPPHYMLTDAGRDVLKKYALYKPFHLQSNESGARWWGCGRFWTLSGGISFAAKMRAVCTPRHYRILDELGNTVWVGESL